MSKEIKIDSNEFKHTSGEINTTIEGYSNNGYLTGLINDNDKINVNFKIPDTRYYKIDICYASPNEEVSHKIFINNECYGNVDFEKSRTFVTKSISQLRLNKGINRLEFIKEKGNINIDYIKIERLEEEAETNFGFSLSNKNASQECIDLMKMFSKICGSGILSGQHCNKASGSDIEYVKLVTGKTPAILGFDLLSYSFGTNSEDRDFECIDELVNNRGSVETAIKYGENSNSVITLCWHWFSPMNGRNKSFYSDNTTFDLEKALINGTEENISIIRDMDAIAYELNKFKEKKIPILWRPFHEACGRWFWWGSKGAEVCIKLYRLMYDRYVNYHKLNNLIWVWNSPKKEWNPGDDVVDIYSVDYYAPIGNHGPLTNEYLKAIESTQSNKAIALAENGPIPDPKLLKKTKTSWLWFMTWNNFGNNFMWNTKDELRKFYNDPYVINSEDLGRLRVKIK